MSASASERLLFKDAHKRVLREWSAPAFAKLGARIQRALLAEEVLFLASTQDESISDAAVRRIIEQGWTWVIETAESTA